MTISADPLSDDFLALARTPRYIADPYPFLASLRATAPAVPTRSGIWLVGRYADVLAGLRDRTLSCDFAAQEQATEYLRGRGLDDRFPMPLNALDPPDHKRIRAVVAPPFAPAEVDRIRPLVEAVVIETLDRLAGRTEIDLVADVAYAVPITVIARMFGIPDADRPMLVRWSRVFGAVSDPDAMLDGERPAEAAEVTREAGDYFGRLLVRRRRQPGPDLMSAWLAAYRDGGALTVPELLVNGVFLLMVGHHNTVSLIANGIHALLGHPGERDRLRDRPGLIGNAVEEMLRFDGPVQTATRFTTGPHRFGDVEIPGGSQVMLLLGAANRDGEVFADPDRLVLDRPDAGRNLGLGRGLHACVGGPLARLEAGLTIGGLLGRFPGLAAAGEPERPRPSFSLRSMTRFPLRLR